MTRARERTVFYVCEPELGTEGSPRRSAVSKRSSAHAIEHCGTPSTA
jgi:hypothetical protein